MKKKLLAVLACIMSLGLGVFAGCNSKSSGSPSGESSLSETSSEVSSEDVSSSEESSSESSSEDPTCEHVYDNACDTDCNECGETRTVGEHAYDNACDTDCNECGETRTVGDHAYDNDCDTDCNECGETRTVGDHVYDNDCDTDCNECGETRTAGDHVYDNACDTDCNECGETRTVDGHAYDNACDTDCNECGETREVGDHAYDNDSDTECNECGTTREIVTLSKRQDVDLDLTYNEGLVVSSDNMTLDLSEVANVASVTSITYNGVALEGASYAEGKIVAPKASFGTAFGEATVVVQAVNNDGVEMLINAPVLLITKAISNAEELDAMYALADALDLNESGKSYAFVSDGYFVLDQNVAYNKTYNAWPTWDDANGKWRNATAHGFKGTFDGRGYTIDGMEISSKFNAFVTLLHADGIIKNVGFNNAKISGIASGLVCAWGGGTIENVYVQYAVGAFAPAGGYAGTFFAADNARGITADGGLTIKDCYIDASAINDAQSSAKKGWIGSFDATATDSYVDIQGVYVLATYQLNLLKEVNNGTEVYNAFSSTEDMLADSDAQAELAKWNTEYWTIVDGVPTWKTAHVYDNLCDVDCNECGATRVVGEHKYENACDVDCNVCGGTREAEDHAYDNACDVDCNVCGETREASDHAYDNACDVDCNECGDVREVGDHVYDNDDDTECNECGASKSVVTLSKRQDVDLDLTYNEGLVVSSDNMTLDLSEVANIASVSSIAYNGEALEGASYAEGKIVAPKASFGTAFGEATVVIQAVNTDGVDMLINAPILLITKAISNAEELDAWYTLADALDKNSSGTSYAFVSDGYFILDQDVAYNKTYNAWPTWDAAGGKWRDATKNGFKGTLDGRGYNIEGLTIGTNYSAFVTLLQADGIIKNIGFTNAALSSVASGLVCVWGCGTIENVYVQYAAGSFGLAGGYAGTFFAADNVRGVTANGGLTVKDCYIDATAITSAPSSAKKGWIGSFAATATDSYVDVQGVYVLATFNLSVLQDVNSGTEVYNVFSSADAMLADSAAQAELATWDTNYWTIVNGVPTWKSIQTA